MALDWSTMVSWMTMGYNKKTPDSSLSPEPMGSVLIVRCAAIDQETTMYRKAKGRELLMSGYGGFRKLIVVACTVALSTALLGACGQTTSAPSATGGGRQTAHSEGGTSRVRLYDSVASIADDSDLVITGKVDGTKVVRDVDDSTDFTLADVTVAQVLKGTLDVDHVTVRQTGSADQGTAEKLLSEGSVVMLFLTSSGLPDDLASQYYVTGANAGVYTVSDAKASAAWRTLRAMSDGEDAARDAESPSFGRLNPDSGDTLPSSLTVDEVAKAIAQ